jgi:hypothetical protein
MSDEEYKVGDVEHNVKVAVKKLREAYWSTDTPKYANQFWQAEKIIISAICFQDYTVQKEGE